MTARVAHVVFGCRSSTLAPDVPRVAVCLPASTARAGTDKLVRRLARLHGPSRFSSAARRVLAIARSRARRLRRDRSARIRAFARLALRADSVLRHHARRCHAPQGVRDLVGGILDAARRARSGSSPRARTSRREQAPFLKGMLAFNLGDVDGLQRRRVRALRTAGARHARDGGRHSAQTACRSR